MDGHRGQDLHMFLEYTVQPSHKPAGEDLGANDLLKKCSQGKPVRKWRSEIGEGRDLAGL